MTLCRGKCANPQTIIFAGNGSIETSNYEDGWKVVKKFLINAERTHESIDPELFLLRCAEDLRFYTQQAIDCLKAKEYVQADTPPGLPALLCDRYQLAEAYNNEIFRTKKKPEIIEKALEKENTCIITSNWDMGLWNDTSVSNLCHIHGRCDIPESLILPTETFASSYFFLEDLNNAKKQILDIKLIEFFKTRVSILLEAEKRTADWIFSPRLETIILWGIHLHIYDSEIISKIMDLKRRTTESMVSQHLSGTPVLSPIREVYVVNPDKKALKRAGGIFSENLFEEEGFIMNHIDPTTGMVDINDIEKI